MPGLATPTVEVEWVLLKRPNSGHHHRPNGKLTFRECVNISFAHSRLQPLSVCLETNVQFTSQSTPGAQHSWDFETAPFPVRQPRPCVLHTGNYTVLLTVTPPSMPRAIVCC